MYSRTLNQALSRRFAELKRDQLNQSKTSPKGLPIGEDLIDTDLAAIGILASDEITSVTVPTLRGDSFATLTHPVSAEQKPHAAGEVTDAISSMNDVSKQHNPCGASSQTMVDADSCTATTKPTTSDRVEFQEPILVDDGISSRALLFAVVSALLLLASWALYAGAFIPSTHALK